MQKKYNKLKKQNYKKEKIKKGRRRKKRKTPQNCKSPMQMQVYNNNKNVTEYTLIHIHP